MSKSLAEEFNVKSRVKTEILTDYEIFPDKELLETLRKSIISNLIDRNIPIGMELNDFINEEIELAIEGYDLTNLERSHIFSLIDEEINGSGPLTLLLEDENVTEIMVNSPHDIYVEIDGKISKEENVSFINEEHIIRTIQRLIQPLGRTIDATNPMVDSRLSDGSRINAVIPPLSVSGPIMTIRKFKKSTDTIDDLIRIGTLTPYMARFLEAAVKSKLNIIISGGTGSGKTTLLNIISGFIDESERIVTIEDAAELSLHQEHVISLETKTTNYNDEGEVTIRDLVINSLRMRPDRIIVGEVRGKESFDMLQAMNTGHEGSLTTIHANSPIDSLNRLETLVLMSGMDIPIRAVREYITNALDIVVNIERMMDGKRKVTSICEVIGLNEGNITLKEIFAFRQLGLTENKEVNGEFILYKGVPQIYNKMRARGISDLDDMFQQQISKQETNQPISKPNVIQSNNIYPEEDKPQPKPEIQNNIKYESEAKPIIMTPEEIANERKRINNLPLFLRAKELE